MSQNNPIRVYVTHSWETSDDYLRVFEYLESARNFFYKNLSEPERNGSGDREAQREEIRRQMAHAEVVIGLPSLFAQHRDLIVFQLTFAKAADKPVILMKHFGSNMPLPKELQSLSDSVVDWDERALVDAIKREARHEETARWDTIEFKLD